MKIDQHVFSLLNSSLGTRQLAMDDDLKEKSTEFIQKNFNAILDTREFHAIPTIKFELIGKQYRFVSFSSSLNIRDD